MFDRKIVSERKRAFAQLVNETLQKLIAPHLERNRDFLLQQGIAPEEVEKRLLKVKIEIQAQFLPQVKEHVKEELIKHFGTEAEDKPASRPTQNGPVR